MINKELLKPIKIDDSSISDKVFNLLKNAILSGELKPGERLVERKLSEKLGISRTPVREAIQKLKSQGLAVQLPRKGAVVSMVTPREVIDVFNIREVLEGLAARLAAENANKRQINQLNRILNEMEKCVALNNEEELEDLHIKFHETIYKIAGNEKLYQMLINLQEYIRTYTRVGYSFHGRIEEATMEHSQIVREIESHNASRAEYYAKRHIENSRDAYISKLEEEKSK
ncbi:GntR family transcriptional regulator [Calorimonas adulescens]|jgi:Bacterial regulatory proteins, gntR family./FCD domain.|uniref:GntR family transcriptional regulator n=1 Tax=Calorimonas adulescens TaxID=2606906 RepID=A0A5D8QB22_9THEO|nr:GntR family transcriptional regulator [Calorimonas adulescens]TZE80976.1 GntR family transcriptional regulator [Calorimonas adulescens]